MKFRDRLARLIDVKTIVTFALTAAFVYLSIIGEVKPEIFMTIYTQMYIFTCIYY